MEQGMYVLPQLPAGSDPVSIQIESEHHIDQSVKKSLQNCLISPVPKGQHFKVLILGARCGLTAQLLLPVCSEIDLVESGSYYTLLQERFEKGKDVKYFHGKQGFIGEHYTLNKPNLNQTKVRVISADDFASKVNKHYNVIVLQNCLIDDKHNLVKELIKIDHDYLLTMLVPGHIVQQPFFPFICTLEKLILIPHYQKVFQEQIQSKRSITGRRTEIYLYQVYGWKRQNKDEQSKQQINKILEQASSTIAKEKEKKLAKAQDNPYQTQELVNVYLNFHFGANSLGVQNFPAACARVCIQKAQSAQIGNKRALDLGCAVGRTTVQLAKMFDEVIGIDFSAAFIKAADSKLADFQEIASKVKFQVGDACNLNPNLGKFNLIFGGNLIDRVPDPAAFLNSVSNFLQPQGLLILTSPYSWLQEYTPKQKWIGGYIENGKPVTTNDGLKTILSKAGFDLFSSSEDIRFSIKDNDWVYQYTLAWATFWRKR